MVASLALRGPAQVAVMLLGLMGVVTLYSVWTRRSGLSVSGYRRGRTLPITLGLLMAAAIAVGTAVSTRDIPGYGWTPLACGGVFGLISAMASAAWDRRWVADMEEGR